MLVICYNYSGFLGYCYQTFCPADPDPSSLGDAYRPYSMAITYR